MKNWIALVVSLMSSSAWAGAPVGYAKATSQLGQAARPTAYQPLNLLDGKEETSWCEGASGNGVGETVVIGFKDAAQIDEVRLANGDARDGRSFLAHNRIRKLVLRGANAAHTLTLADGRAPQTFKLSPALEGDEITLEILEVLPGKGGADATCLSDIIFSSKGRPLNGRFLADKLVYDRGRSQLMSTWYAGPEGAPDRTLAFYFDGTFHFSWRPYDPEQKPVDLTGQYGMQAGKLMLKLSGKPWVDAQARRTVSADDDGFARTKLEIRAETLGEGLASSWADHR